VAAERIIVGAVGDGDDLQVVARRLRDAGHEVVLAGAHQTPDQLARTAVAEDASRLVVPGDAVDRRQVVTACDALGADDVMVDGGCDAFDATSPRVKG
jgi:methylmalonyl-CoA mutase C-terminal domain/subunit